MESDDVWVDAEKLLAARHGKLVRLVEQAQFNPSERLDHLDKLPPPLPRRLYEISESIIDLFSGELSARARAKGEMLVGVRRKGMALLREVSRRVDFEGAPLFELDCVVPDDDDQAPIIAIDFDVASKAVLLVDDSVHHGRAFSAIWRELVKRHAASVALSTLVASEDGLKRIESACGPIEKIVILPVSEERFCKYYQSLVVPALDRFQGGTISDKPHLVLRFDTSTHDPGQWAFDALEALHGVSGFSTLVALPPLDGHPRRVFHGTLEYDDVGRRRCDDYVAGKAVLDQAKLRVFVAVERPLTIHVYGIYWLIAPQTMRDGEPEQLCTKLALEELNRVERHLIDAMSEVGYVLVRAEMRPPGDLSPGF